MSFAALAVVAALALGAFAPAASAAPLVTTPEHPDRPPDGFVVTPREARQAADGVESVMRARAEHPGLRGTLVIPLYRPGPRYEVTYRLGGKSQPHRAAMPPRSPPARGAGRGGDHRRSADGGVLVLPLHSSGSRRWFSQRQWGNTAWPTIRIGLDP